MKEFAKRKLVEAVIIGTVVPLCYFLVIQVRDWLRRRQQPPYPAQRRVR